MQSKIREYKDQLNKIAHETCVGLGELKKGGQISSDHHDDLARQVLAARRAMAEILNRIRDSQI